MKDREIAVVTVADRRYLPPACCQLVSTANHLASDDNAQLFLVVCDVTDEDVSNADRFFKTRGMSVNIVVPDFIDKMMTPLKTRWPRAAYLRLYFDHIFDERWRRIVYFDADTRVCAALSPLLTADLRAQPIGAVHDFIYYVTGNIHRRRHDLFLADDAPYFQSGVMVFDWPKMLECRGLFATRDFLFKHPEACYEAPDQDALNATFENRWTPLDPRWNLHEIYLMVGHELKPKLMHYTSTKPWSLERPRAWREAAAWYQAELTDSPWSDFVESQNVWEATRANIKFAIKRYGPHIREKLASTMPSLLDWLEAKAKQDPRRVRSILLAWLQRERERKQGYMPWVPRRSKDVEVMAGALMLEAEAGCPLLRPPEAILTRGHW